MSKIENWSREEALEHERRPYVWTHGVDDTLTLRVEDNGPVYRVVLRRQYGDEYPVSRIGSRSSKDAAYDLATSWADNHPNPLEAKKEPFVD